MRARRHRIAKTDIPLHMAARVPKEGQQSDTQPFVGGFLADGFHRVAAASTNEFRDIEADVREAKTFGVDGTPTFLVNGILVRGAVPVEEFERVISLVEGR